MKEINGIRNFKYEELAHSTGRMGSAGESEVRLLLGPIILLAAPTISFLIAWLLIKPNSRLPKHG